MRVELEVPDTAGVRDKLSDDFVASEVEEFHDSVLGSGGQRRRIHRMEVHLTIQHYLRFNEITLKKIDSERLKV